MPIELNKAEYAEALASLQKYAEQNLEEPLGNLAAGLLLGFFIEEIGPTLYNRGVADAQARMQLRVDELDGEVHQEPFRYWHRHGKKPRR